MNNALRTNRNQSHIIIELIECQADSKVSTTVIKKSNNVVDMVTFKTSEETVIESSLFDTYAMVLEGNLILKINGKSTKIPAGQGKVLPAFNSYYLNSKQQFKIMLTTVIQGGY